MSLKLKQIAVSQKNYLTLKQLGSAGDSFNDVVSEILSRVDQQQFKTTIQVKRKQNEGVNTI
jgi:predicted CopG family antitoxin